MKPGEMLYLSYEDVKNMSISMKEIVEWELASGKVQMQVRYDV